MLYAADMVACRVPTWTGESATIKDQGSRIKDQGSRIKAIFVVAEGSATRQPGLLTESRWLAASAMAARLRSARLQCCYENGRRPAGPHLRGPGGRTGVGA
jgi:hypothetical protein